MLQLEDREKAWQPRLQSRQGCAPPPEPHLLGLQEVGIPQLADDHFTLLE